MPGGGRSWASIRGSPRRASARDSVRRRDQDAYQRRSGTVLRLCDRHGDQVPAPRPHCAGRSSTKTLATVTTTATSGSATSSAASSRSEQLATGMPCSRGDRRGTLGPCDGRVLRTLAEWLVATNRGREAGLELLKGTGARTGRFFPKIGGTSRGAAWRLGRVAALLSPGRVSGPAPTRPGPRWPLPRGRLRLRHVEAVDPQLWSTCSRTWDRPSISS